MSAESSRHRPQTPADPLLPFLRAQRCQATRNRVAPAFGCACIDTPSSAFIPRARHWTMRNCILRRAHDARRPSSALILRARHWAVRNCVARISARASTSIHHPARKCNCTARDPLTPLHPRTKSGDADTASSSPAYCPRTPADLFTLFFAHDVGRRAIVLPRSLGRAYTDSDTSSAPSSRTTPGDAQSLC